METEKGRKKRRDGGRKVENRERTADEDATERERERGCLKKE